jgi:hypothetical protein
MTDSFPFLRLPLELREQVYSLYFKPADRITFPEATGFDDAFNGGIYKFDFDIYSVSKQVKTEAEEVWRRENVFVCIETPWPQAGTLKAFRVRRLRFAQISRSWGELGQSHPLKGFLFMRGRGNTVIDESL